MQRLLLITLFGTCFMLCQNKFIAQCPDPIEFYDQTSLDAFFADNPSCTSLGTVMIDNSGDGDPIADLYAMSNVLSIDSLIILDYTNNMDISGLNNLTALGNLTTFMVHDFTFCSNITSINRLHIEYHEDLNFSNMDVDFSGFDDLQSAHSINLGFHMTNGNYVDIFPNLMSLNFLNFEPWFYNLYYNTAFGTLDGFHALTTIDSINIGIANIFLCTELSIGNSLTSMMQLQYLGTSAIFNSFQNVQTINDLVIYSESQQVILLPQLAQTTFTQLYLNGNDQLYFPQLQTVDDFSLEYGGFSSIPDLPIVIDMPLLASCNNFLLAGYSEFNAFVLPPLNYNFSQLDSVHGHFIIQSTNLEDLNTFSNLSYIGGTISIQDNADLSLCHIDAICDRLNNAPNDVTITGNTGACAELLDVAAACVIPTITGQVYYDLNCNEIFDTEDISVTYPLIMDSNMNAIGSSNSNGQYTIVAIPNGLLTYQPVAPVGTITPSAVAINTDTLSGNTIVDFPLCPDGTFHDVEVDAALSTWIRNGFSTEYAFVLTNHSFHSETAQLQVDLNLFAQFSAWDITLPYSIVGETIVFDPIVLGPFEQQLIYIRSVLSTWTPLGTSVHMTATVSIANTDSNNSNNTSQVNAVVVGSYDPNDIIVNKPLIDVEQSDANGDWLTYRIRFQNTGNFPADFVNVVSEQDELVDMSTIQMIDASHANSWSFNGREVTWFFENIQLPDSTTDLEGSQGYIIYKVRTMQGLGVGDTLEVNAAIYFDFNEPVITNTATTEYYLCPEDLIVASDEPTICEFDWATAYASDGYETYTWSENDQVLSTMQGFSYFEFLPGIHTLTCRAQSSLEQCESSASIALEVIDVPEMPIIIQNGNTLTASGTGTFVWGFNGGLFTNTTNTLEITQTGNYSVFIDGDCPSEAAAGNFTYIGIEDLAQEEIILFPNPAENFITLQHVDYPSEVSIIDMTGRTCLSILNNNPNQTIDLDNLSSGTYRMQVKNPHGVWSLLFIKE